MGENIFRQHIKSKVPTSESNIKWVDCRCSNVQNKPRFLQGLFGCQAIVDVGLFITGCWSCRRCYLAPCEEGRGLQDIYRVHDGLGFQLVFSSIVMMAHALSSIYMIHQGLGGPSFGWLLGSTAMLVVLMLGLFAVWIVIASDILAELSDNSHAYTESGRFMKRNDDLTPAAQFITLATGLMGLTYLLIAVLTKSWQSSLLGEEGEKNKPAHAAVGGSVSGDALVFTNV